jgi:hypothetical protein
LAALAWRGVPPRACFPIAGAVPAQRLAAPAGRGAPPRACFPIAGAVPAQRLAAPARVRLGWAVLLEARAEEHSGVAPAAAPPPVEWAGLTGLGEAHP